MDLIARFEALESKVNFLEEKILALENPKSKKRVQTQSSLCNLEGVPISTILWKIYAELYSKRYSVQPVRNARTNRNIADLIKRVGVENAEDLIKWFLRENNHYYVKRCHDIGVLLASCEECVTKMRTGLNTDDSRKVQNANATAQYLAKKHGGNNGI